MVVNTVIDIGGPKKAPVIPSRPRVIEAVNLSGDSMRQHEQIMTYRRKVNELNSYLSAAMDSLESANKDIDRLNAEVERLTEELRREREKNAKLSKKEKSEKSDKSEKVAKPKDDGSSK